MMRSAAGTQKFFTACVHVATISNSYQATEANGDQFWFTMSLV